MQINIKKANEKGIIIMGKTIAAKTIIGASNIITRNTYNSTKFFNLTGATVI